MGNANSQNSNHSTSSSLTPFPHHHRCGDHAWYKPTVVQTSSILSNFVSTKIENTLALTQQFLLNTPEYQHKYKISLHEYSYDDKSLMLNAKTPLHNATAFTCKDGRPKVSSFPYHRNVTNQIDHNDLVLRSV
eukprot:577988_1